MRGTVGRVVAERTARRRVDVVRVVLRDETGAVEAVWFNQRYLSEGAARRHEPECARHLSATGRSFIVCRQESRDPRRGRRFRAHRRDRAGVPGERTGVGAAAARAGAGSPAGHAPATRPAAGRAARAEGLPSRADATLAVHLPRDLDEAKVARGRLVLEELLLMQVGLLLHKSAQQRRAAAPAFAAPEALSRAFLDGLPFELTSHQLAALDELDADLARNVPMRRLLQGDVGSGKTVVALYCLVRAVESGHQAALMAPTETLAMQHAETAARFVGKLAPAELLTASLTAKERRATLERIASGDDPPRHRHARTAAGGRGVRRAGPAGRRRAAPLRGRAAGRARAARRARRLRAARPAHDGDPDPADARPHRVRRSRRDHHRGLAGGPPAGGHPSRRRVPERGGLRLCAHAGRPGASGLRRLPGHRRVGLNLRGHGRGRGRAPAGRALQAEPRGRGARAAQVRRPRRGHARLQGRGCAGAGLHEPDRGRASTCPTRRS